MATTTTKIYTKVKYKTNNIAKQATSKHSKQNKSVQKIG